jgi:hypothetical protein
MKYGCVEYRCNGHSTGEEAGNVRVMEVSTCIVLEALHDGVAVFEHELSLASAPQAKGFQIGRHPSDDWVCDFRHPRNIVLVCGYQ